MNLHLEDRDLTLGVLRVDRDIDESEEEHHGALREGVVGVPSVHGLNSEIRQSLDRVLLVPGLADIELHLIDHEGRKVALRRILALGVCRTELSCGRSRDDGDCKERREDAHCDLPGLGRDRKSVV